MIHPDLLTVLEAVTIDSPTRYTIQGRPREVAESTDGRDLSRILQLDLYERLYTRTRDADRVPAGHDLARRDHLAACSAANTGEGTWEAGWTLGPLDDNGRIAVSQDGVTFWVGPEGLRSETPTLHPGATCRVRIGKELRNLVPGFYVAIGNGDPEAPACAPDDPLARTYWHLRAGAAAPFVHETTRRLNALSIPFRVKVLSDPIAYRRADAGVLYLSARDFPRAEASLVAVHEAIATGLRPEVPLMTQQLATGLGLAEDPGDGQSFGEHRCQLVAEALWLAFLRGETGLRARSETLASAFRAADLDPNRPDLGPRGLDLASPLAFSGGPR